MNITSNSFVFLYQDRWETGGIWPLSTSDIIRQRTRLLA